MSRRTKAEEAGLSEQEQVRCTLRVGFPPAGLID